jgi:putative phosphoesterase
MDRRAIEGRRFALVADTHDNLVDWPAALSAIAAAAGAVDGFIHCGDLSTLAALDTLGERGPVWAVRSEGDPPAKAPRLVDGARVLEAGGLTIGVTFALTPAAGAAQALFGAPVDVCVYGGTHAAAIGAAGGVLYVNPGSPTLADKKTIGVLTIEAGLASVEIIAV